MNAYELALVVKPLLPDDVKTKVTSELEKLVEKLEGKISVKEEWGKRHLAYPIKGHEEGYYVFFKVELSSDKTQQFQAQLRQVKDVLRFLLISENEL